MIDTPKKMAKASINAKKKTELILAALMVEDIFDTLCVAGVDLECFHEAELHLWYVFDEIRRSHEEYKQHPTLHELSVALDTTLEDVDDDTYNKTADLINIWKERGKDPEKYIRSDAAAAYTENLIKWREWNKLRRMSTSPDQIPVDIHDTLEEALTKVGQAKSLNIKGIAASFPIGYEKKRPPKAYTPYEIPFLDRHLGGGGSPGDIYCVLGPTGGGKTTLLQQASISLAREQYRIWETNSRSTPLGLVYMLSYEIPAYVMQYRALAYAATIEFSVLAQDMPLSTSRALNHRDRESFGYLIENGIVIPGEIERKRAAERELNVNWRLMDFSGVDTDDVTVGGGWFQEVKSRIQRDLEETRKLGVEPFVAGVFIDYLGIMARRHCTVQKKPIETALRSLLTDSIDCVRRYVAYPFQCPVMVSHQLNGKACELKPGVIADKSEAAEHKLLPENCDFVFVLSNKSDETNLVRMNCQKQRREAKHPPVILNLKGQFARFDEEDKTWEFNDASRSFYLLSEVEKQQKAADKAVKDRMKKKTKTTGIVEDRMGDPDDSN